MELFSPDRLIPAVVYGLITAAIIALLAFVGSRTIDFIGVLQPRLLRSLRARIQADRRASRSTELTTLIPYAAARLSLLVFAATLATSGTVESFWILDHLGSLPGFYATYAQWLMPVTQGFLLYNSVVLWIWYLRMTASLREGNGDSPY